jgi:hypothetical protein
MTAWLYSISRSYRLGFLFSSILLASFLFQLPTSYDFSNFVLYDPGTALRVDQLIARGYQPTLDFGFPYGLISLLVGRVFFAFTGRTPVGYLLFMLAAQILIAFGIARLAANCRWITIVFLAVAIPHAIIPVYVNITHPLEAALLLHALADLSSGWYARALVVTTACLFIKPVLAYVLGLIIVILIITQVSRQRNLVNNLIKHFIPAVITGVVCIVISVCYFGWLPLKATLLPLTGLKSYQALDFGFFSNGRSFWLPTGGTISDYAQHYLFSAAGIWLLGTVLLGLWGIFSLGKLWRAASDQHVVVLALAICHFFFIFVLFGWPGSWTYYSSLLIVGVGLGAAAHNVRPIWIGILILIALVGHTQRYQHTVNAWRWSARGDDTAGLWAYQDQRAEWSRVRAIAAQREVFFLNNGCAELLLPGVRAPLSFFLSPATQTPIEFANIARQIEEAEVVVTFNQGPILDPWYWEEFAAQRRQFIETWRGNYLTIYERAQR